MTEASADAAPEDRLLTMRQAAELSPFAWSTFKKWRLTWPDGDRRGPEPEAIEGRVFYRQSKFNAWLGNEEGTAP